MYTVSVTVPAMVGIISGSVIIVVVLMVMMVIVIRHRRQNQLPAQATNATQPIRPLPARPESHNQTDRRFITTTVAHPDDNGYITFYAESGGPEAKCGQVTSEDSDDEKYEHQYDNNICSRDDYVRNVGVAANNL